LTIYRLLLQDSLAAPCGEPAEGITHRNQTRQFPQIAYLCALALPYAPGCEAFDSDDDDDIDLLDFSTFEVTLTGP
jgi:hypothetical protein